MKKNPFPKKIVTVDFCVIGGGMAGICAAISAARNGISVAIVQDRPMFGGNASSEVRMWISGAQGPNNQEGGILEEIQLRNLYRNPYKNYSIWDGILFEIVKEHENIQVFLNTTCIDGEMEGNRLISATCWQLTSQSYVTINATYFADCSGDSILAPITGASYVQGREAKSQYQESFGPDKADSFTMGNSILLQAKECTDDRSFIAPSWAKKIPDEFLENRKPDLRAITENYWYLELGGTQDTIADAETIRDDLLSLAYGMWDYLKNGPGQKEKNKRFELDWVGMLPGKRESRRYVGDITMTANDIETGGLFKDVVAYGGWPMDDHHPGGFYAKAEPNINHPAPSPFGIPYRTLYSENIENLFFAGRNISVSHAAFSSTRVMGTCSLLGQAIGTAAAIAVTYGLSPREVGRSKLHLLQQTLMDDDCYLPNVTRAIPSISKDAKLMATSNNSSIDNLRNGLDRPGTDGDNGWYGYKNDIIEYTFPSPQAIKKIRIVFDSDFNRMTLPQDGLKRNMYTNKLLSFEPFYVPKTLVKEFTLQFLSGEEEIKELEIKNNIKRLVTFEVDDEVTDIRLILKETWGSEQVHVFSFDVE